MQSFVFKDVLYFHFSSRSRRIYGKIYFSTSFPGPFSPSRFRKREGGGTLGTGLHSFEPDVVSYISFRGGTLDVGYFGAGVCYWDFFSVHVYIYNINHLAAKQKIEVMKSAFVRFILEYACQAFHTSLPAYLSGLYG